MNRVVLLLPLLAFSLLIGCSDGGGALPASSSTSAGIQTPTGSRTATESPASMVTPEVSVTPPPSPTPTRTATDVPPTASPTRSATSTVGVTPPPSASPTATATVQPTTETPSSLCCGDGVVSGSEECDDGNNVGGDDCAANCTFERNLTVPLQGHAEVPAGTFLLSFEIDTTQTLRLGRPTRGDASPSCHGDAEFEPGELPVTQRAADLTFAPVSVPGFVCACIRAVEIKRCGPALIHPSGDDCGVGADCTADATVCGSEADCRFAHGKGNASSGVIGCNGLDDVDYAVKSDGGAGASCIRTGGRAAPGSAFIYATTMIGTIGDGGTCSEDQANMAKGRDGVPCTGDDPPASRGTANTTPLTTGIAGVQLQHANGSMPSVEPDSFCIMSPCCFLSPCTASGWPFSCDTLAQEPPSLGDAVVCNAVAGTVSQSMVGEATVLPPAVAENVLTICFEAAP